MMEQHISLKVHTKLIFLVRFSAAFCIQRTNIFIFTTGETQKTAICQLKIGNSAIKVVPVFRRTGANCDVETMLNSFFT